MNPNLVCFWGLLFWWGRYIITCACGFVSNAFPDIIERRKGEERGGREERKGVRVRERERSDCLF